MKKQIALGFILLVVGVFSRLVPHLNNFSPIIAMSVFAGVLYSRAVGILLMIATMFVADVLLSPVMGYPMFGAWMWFTYSGVVLSVFVGSMIPYVTHRYSTGFLTVLGAAFGFWAWTNLGTWLTSNMYLPHSFASLLTCYVSAIPFLQNQILGSLLWTAVMFGVLKVMRHHVVSSREMLSSA